MKGSCARFLAGRRRLINFALGAGFQSRQMDMEVRFPVRGNSVPGFGLDLSRVSGTYLKMETLKNLVRIWCQNTIFAN